jgi:sulfhydrogenase subunit beta (sulfur reductase)
MRSLQESSVRRGDGVIVERSNFQELLGALVARGYRVIGPTVMDGAIVYDELESTEQLPVGWTDEQDGGTYRLKKRTDEALFGYAVGPQSWKTYLHPPVLRLWRAEKSSSPERSERGEEGGFQVIPEVETPQKMAFIGVRSCELHAIAVQDRVFLEGPYIDPAYKARRDGLFIVAANCGQAGGTCFCVSMQTGPKATSGYDLALTEILDDKGHYFVVDVGTELGAEVISEVQHRRASEGDKAAAQRVVERATSQMGRSMDTTGIKDLLYQNYEHPRWDQVAERCLTCGNCTMVCPTCFCTSVEDVTDLAGGSAERLRKWDSCFTMDFSYVHGGSVRSTPKSRYRQWMTHKLATWQDQFGTSGCVGCGRCITWCPVGIDITEEARVIREGNIGTRQESEDPDATP